MFDKIVIVTKETQLEQLVRRFTSKSQAAFYIAQSAVGFAASQGAERGSDGIGRVRREADENFREIEQADTMYRDAVETIRRAIPPGVAVQQIDWTHLPNFLFGDNDLVLTVGPDGLVINTAKYLDGQPIVAVNPDPGHIDGILLPFTIDDALRRIPAMARGDIDGDDITIARATLDDGQVMHGVNDLFIGPRSHTSFRYSLSYQGDEEVQSSSGIIVSTGAGSTGWFRSIIEGARGVTAGFDDAVPSPGDSRFPWDADFLHFSVREPWPGKMSGASIVFGRIERGESLIITSQSPQNGVIFSDGIEQDYLEFNAGRTATIGLADHTVRLARL